MHRVLTSSPAISSYSFCLLLGLIAGYFIARANARRIGLETRHIDNLALLLGAVGLIGARTFSWLFYFPPGISLWSALTEPGGGMVFYGGVVFGLLAAAAYARLGRLSFRNLLDVLAAPLAIGLAVGRIGCFLAGCCWGDLCVNPQAFAPLSDSKLSYQVQTFPAVSSASVPFAVRFPADSGALRQHEKLHLLPHGSAQSLPVHPVQLYEAGLAVALTFWLQRRFRRRQWPGEVFCAFCIAYGAIRFATEFLRADNSPIYFGLTLSQMISLLAAGICGMLWVLMVRSPSRRAGLAHAHVHAYAPENASEFSQPSHILLSPVPSALQTRREPDAVPLGMLILK